MGIVPPPNIAPPLNTTLTNAVPARFAKYLLLIFAAVMAGIFIYDAAVSRHLQVTGLADAPDLTKMLAPFLAVATAIERFWEAIFNGLESFALSTGRLFGVTGDLLKTLNETKKSAVAAVSVRAQQSAAAQTDPSAAADLASAQVNLSDVNAMIAETLKSPQYVALKRAITVFGSLIIGEIISLSVGLGFFNAAKVPLPPLLDMVLTGLLIGAGPEPLHQVINSFQDIRDALSGLAVQARGTGLKNATEAVMQAESALPPPPEQEPGPPAPLDQARRLLQQKF